MYISVCVCVCVFFFCLVFFSSSQSCISYLIEVIPTIVNLGWIFFQCIFGGHIIKWNLPIPCKWWSTLLKNGTAPPTSIFLFERPTLFFFPSKFLMIPNGYLPNIILGICWVSQWKIKLKKSADPLCNLMPKPHYAGVGALLYTL